MSNLIDPPDSGNADNVTTPDTSIPEKLQGKSPQELAEMYSQLESTLGRQSNELGELRRTLNEVTQANQPVDEEVDFYTDPDAAFSKKVAPLVEALTELRVDNMRHKLTAQHPSYETVIADGKFQEWVANSQVRIRLWQEANVGDFNAANELFSNWGEVNKSKEQSQEQATEAVQRDRKLRAATSEKGSVGIAPGKILKAADLQALRQTNPERYRQNLPEIMKAYAEGRVQR